MTCELCGRVVERGSFFPIQYVEQMFSVPTFCIFKNSGPSDRPKSFGKYHFGRLLISTWMFFPLIFPDMNHLPILY